MPPSGRRTNRPTSSWSVLGAVGAAVWQAGATTDGVLRRASADRMHVASYMRLE